MCQWNLVILCCTFSRRVQVSFPEIWTNNALYYMYYSQNRPLERWLVLGIPFVSILSQWSVISLSRAVKEGKMDGGVTTGCRLGQYCSDERCAACLQILPLSVCFPHLKGQWHSPAAALLYTVQYSVCLYTLGELNRFFRGMFWHKSVAEPMSHSVHRGPPTAPSLSPERETWSLHPTKLENKSSIHAEIHCAHWSLVL